MQLTLIASYLFIYPYVYAGTICGTINTVKHLPLFFSLSLSVCCYCEKLFAITQGCCLWNFLCLVSDQSKLFALAFFPLASPACVYLSLCLSLSAYLFVYLKSIQSPFQTKANWSEMSLKKKNKKKTRNNAHENRTPGGECDLKRERKKKRRIGKRSKPDTQAIYQSIHRSLSVSVSLFICVFLSISLPCNASSSLFFFFFLINNHKRKMNFLFSCWKNRTKRNEKLLLHETRKSGWTRKNEKERKKDRSLLLLQAISPSSLSGASSIKVKKKKKFFIFIVL